MMSWAAHTDKQQTLEFIRSRDVALAQGNGVTWAIEYEGKVVGNIGFDGIAFAFAAWRVDRAELGYWLAPRLWGKGIMTEAATAVMRCGFDTIGLHKITVGCFAENAASRRVIEKLGFNYVGRCADDVWRDGMWHAQLRWELTASSSARPPARDFAGPPSR